MKNIDKLANEIQTAREKYGPFNSTHEVYGVLIEEVEEFFQVVKEKTINSDDDFMSIGTVNYMDNKIDKMRHELLQIAAIALRAIDELEHDQIRWI